jgi:argininosuccinate lyase
MKNKPEDISPSKLWGGRFEGETDALVRKLNDSFSYDCRLWKYDIQGSIAHATMLGEQGIIPSEEAGRIVDGLRDIHAHIESGTYHFDPNSEDIHSAVESLLKEKIGPVAGKLHTARSRNDQVTTDTRLYLRDAVNQIDECLLSFQATLVDTAEHHLGDESQSVPPTILSGFTHMQHAQPVLLSHHLMAYFWMFQRDRERLKDATKRINLLPLGSGALAGTSFPIRRERVAELLEFDGVMENSMDGVSDRDYAIEFLACCSIIAMHCSRLAEEIILWNSPEFGYVELDDSVTTGSSIMPQKKNPDAAELARGKTGRIYGNLTGILTVMKGLPLAYNKDMQEDKELLFDSVDTMLMLLPPFEKTIRTAKFCGARMIEALRGDFSTATDLADYLVRKGIPFREAHHIVGRIVRHCMERKIGLEDISSDELCSFSEYFNGASPDIASVISSVQSRSSYGGASTEAVRDQIRHARLKMAEY